MLKYKLQGRGKQLVKAKKWFPSSQRCSCCGYKNRKVKILSVRERECSVYHTIYNQDVNAAINLVFIGCKNLFGFEAVLRPATIL